MNDPKIVASARDVGRRTATSLAEPGDSWTVLGWIGLVFVAVGGADFVLTWVPQDFGNPEWEFGTVTASFNGLPILVLGLGLLVAAGEASDRKWWRGLGTVGAGVLAVWVLIGFGLWATRISLAFQTVPEQLAIGVRRAVVKTAMQSVAFEGVLVYMLFRAWVGGMNPMKSKRQEIEAA